jgi:broad specificity phosphatase PhoE
MPSLLLIRHAQASYGSADYDVLSERGHQQVARMHEALTARGVRLIDFAFEFDGLTVTIEK